MKLDGYTRRPKWVSPAEWTRAMVAALVVRGWSISLIAESAGISQPHLSVFVRTGRELGTLKIERLRRWAAKIA